MAIVNTIADIRDIVFFKVFVSLRFNGYPMYLYFDDFSRKIVP